MTNYKLHRVLTHILKKTFRGKYIEPFYVEMTKVENEKRLGRYHIRDKTIYINNISRETTPIMVTAIHELTHHILVTEKDHKNHDKLFYDTLYKLMKTAVYLGYVNYNQARRIKDSNTISEMERRSGRVRVTYNPSTDTNEKYRTIYIRNGYTVKNLLQEKKYMFSPLEYLWEKDTLKEEAEQDKQDFLKIDPSLNIEIRKLNDLIVSPVYKIIVTGDTYNNRKFLNEHDYMFDREKKTWNKTVIKDEIQKEKHFLSELPKIAYKII